MKINNRLKKIGDLIPSSSFPLDIGCDHALLSIYLVREKGIKKCCASDNKKGPFDLARKNIKTYRLTNQITTILADGLNAYQEGIDTITISGMGGLSINKIIEDRSDLLPMIHFLILSPNNYTALVRKKMYQFGYIITEEVVVKEKNIIYPILVFEKGKKKYKEKDFYLGPILQTKTDILTREYYERELIGRNSLLNMLPVSHLTKRRQTKKEIKWLKEVLAKQDSNRENLPPNIQSL